MINSSKRLKNNRFILILLILTLIWGCSAKKQGKISDETFEIEKKYPRGPATLTIKVSKKEITPAEQPHLVIEVRINEDYQVELPEFGEKLGEFSIIDYYSPPSRLLSGNQLLYQKTYTLEPFLAGEYKIPPVRVFFWQKDKEEEKAHAVESEELTIIVKTLLPPQEADLTIKEIIPPQELPRSLNLWLLLVIGAVVLIAAVLVAKFIRRRKKSKEAVIHRPPHEIALTQLKILLAEGLIAKGEIKVFYLRLSDILRHYIENRFSLRAPERTTEEFLTDLRYTDTWVPNHKELLKSFLQHCDLVKFAEHQPSDGETDKAVQSAKTFINETHNHEEP